MTTTVSRSGKTKVIVTIDDSKANRVFMRFADADAKARGKRVFAAAVAGAPVGKTGELRDGLRFGQSRDTRGRWSTGYEVVSTAPHTLFVIKPTRPHPIEGNPLLAFFWPKVGANVVFRRVQHPGTKANDFLSRALQAAR